MNPDCEVEPFVAKILWTYDKKCCVCIFADGPDALAYIVKWLHRESELGSRGRKRPIEERVVFPHKEIKWNYTRCAAFVRWRDEDGVWHTRHQKADEKRLPPEIVQENRLKAVEELHEWFVTHHHPLDSELAVEVN